MVGAILHCNVMVGRQTGEGATAKGAEVRRAPPIDRIVVVLLCYTLLAQIYVYKAVFLLFFKLRLLM